MTNNISVKSNGDPRIELVCTLRAFGPNCRVWIRSCEVQNSANRPGRVGTAGSHTRDLKLV